MKTIIDKILGLFKKDEDDMTSHYSELNRIHEENRKKFVPKMLSQNEINELVDNLLIAINWVDKLIEGHNFNGLDNNKVLRQTNPLINGIPLYKFSEELFESDLNYEVYTLENYLAPFNEALKARGSDNRIKFQTLEEKGRIICFDTGLTTHDGAPVAQGNGFVDTYDIPPIDTWIYLKFEFDSYNLSTLFCWIPKEAEQVMQETMDVEIFDSYAWLDSKYPLLYHQIKERIKTLANIV